MRSQGEELLVIEEIIDLDLNIIKGLGNSKKVQNAKIQKALCQVFLDVYGQNKDKGMYIIAIILLDQLEMKRYLQQ